MGSYAISNKNEMSKLVLIIFYYFKLKCVYTVFILANEKAGCIGYDKYNADS